MWGETQIEKTRRSRRFARTMLAVFEVKKEIPDKNCARPVFTPPDVVLAERPQGSRVAVRNLSLFC